MTLRIMLSFGSLLFIFLFFIYNKTPPPPPPTTTTYCETHSPNLAFFRYRSYSAVIGYAINPFTAPACKISGPND